MKKAFVFLTLIALVQAVPVWADTSPVEIHGRIARGSVDTNAVALTLDACSGRYDEALIEFLIQARIPATIFVTKRWLDRNPQAIETLREHSDLFSLQDHGEKHIPAVIGAGREVYGIAGHADMAHLRREVREGAKAVTQATGVAPRWYRGATGVYDEEALDEIRKMGFAIAGFSINADSGATLSKAAVLRRLRKTKGGDVIIAHMNKPDSETAEGLAEGLLELQRQGVSFVRLDQLRLKESRVPLPAQP